MLFCTNATQSILFVMLSIFITGYNGSAAAGDNTHHRRTTTNTNINLDVVSLYAVSPEPIKLIVSNTLIGGVLGAILGATGGGLYGILKDSSSPFENAMQTGLVGGASVGCIAGIGTTLYITGNMAYTAYRYMRLATQQSAHHKETHRHKNLK